MGQDSWQAEHRSPDLRAKAGRAFAGWLPLNMTKIRTRAAVRRYLPGTSRWLDCIPMCMPHSSGKLFSRICIPTNAKARTAMNPLGNPFQGQERDGGWTKLL